MRRDDRGFSLVEMVIILAIMGVLGAAIGIGLGLVNGRPADKCASRLKSVLQSARVTSMGKLDATWVIYRDGSDNIVVKETIQVRDGEDPVVTETVIGDKNISFKYVLNGAVLTLENGPLVIAFDRSSSALKPQPGDGRYCTSIEISKSNRTKTISLDKLTGRVTMD